MMRVVMVRGWFLDPLAPRVTIKVLLLCYDGWIDVGHSPLTQASHPLFHTAQHLHHELAEENPDTGTCASQGYFRISADSGTD